MKLFLAKLIWGFNPNLQNSFSVNLTKPISKPELPRGTYKTKRKLC